MRQQRALENIHQKHIHIHHRRGLSLEPHKSPSKCSNQESHRQRETEAHKHKYCRISQLHSGCGGELASRLLASSSLSLFLSLLLPWYQIKGISQTPCNIDIGPQKPGSRRREGLTENHRGTGGAENCNLNSRCGLPITSTSFFMVTMLLVM